MASSCTGRKCLHSVSRVGPATRMPTSPETSIADPSAKWSVATVLVVLFAAVALAAMLVAVFVLRRRRIRQELPVRSEATGDAGKPAQGEEGVEKERNRIAGSRAVELVVMAGETKPTFLATPTIQCPPLGSHDPGQS